jgi:hypothetical protein
MLTSYFKILFTTIINIMDKKIFNRCNICKKVYSYESENSEKLYRMLFLNRSGNLNLCKKCDDIWIK